MKRAIPPDTPLMLNRADQVELLVWIALAVGLIFGLAAILDRRDRRMRRQSEVVDKVEVEATSELAVGD